MPSLSLDVTILVLIALAFGFFNSLQESSSLVAIVISTRAMRPRFALWMAAIGVGVGPFIFGVAVATTIGKDIVAERAVTLPVLYAAQLASIAWNVVTLWLGIPSSTSHALIGGIVGAVWASHGADALQMNGLLKTLAALFLSPFLGMVSGYLLLKLAYFLASGASPRVNVWFQRGQLLTAVTLALSHGTNAAQKAMGVITLGLVAAGQIKSFYVPQWVIVVSGLSMAFGTLFGGWNLIRTLGAKFYRLRPVHGFSAQSASTAVILGAALLGGPVSTTHVVSSAIVGAGMGERIQMVRWGVVGHIIVSWFLTVPATAGVSALLYEIIQALT